MQLGQPADVILRGDARQFFVQRRQHRAIEQRFGRQARFRLRGHGRRGEHGQSESEDAHAAV